MNNLYNKIYEAVNAGIQKALIINNDQSNDTSVNFHHKEISNEYITYEYKTVDLDLPSGLLWCEYNLGAFPGKDPKDWFGNYYAWGEINPKQNYLWETYEHCDGTYNALTKYNMKSEYGTVDNVKQLDLVDDAVNYVLMGEYRIPNKENYTELMQNTTQKWIVNYKNIQGLYGMLLTSKKNGKTIFFPASGYYIGNENRCDNHRFWTSELGTDNSLSGSYFYIHHGGCHISCDIRYSGLPVRGVLPTN